MHVKNEWNNGRYLFDDDVIVKIRIVQKKAQQEKIFHTNEQRQQNGESLLKRQYWIDGNGVVDDKRAVLDYGQVATFRTHERNYVIETYQRVDDQTEHDRILFEFALVVQQVDH